MKKFATFKYSLIFAPALRDAITISLGEIAQLVRAQDS
jgi:hypothetical protein